LIFLLPPTLMPRRNEIKTAIVFPLKMIKRLYFRLKSLF
jgi:hypothetical protein